MSAYHSVQGKGGEGERERGSTKLKNGGRMKKKEGKGDREEDESFSKGGKTDAEKTNAEQNNTLYF